MTVEQESEAVAQALKEREDDMPWDDTPSRGWTADGFKPWRWQPYTIVCSCSYCRGLRHDD